MIGLLTGSQTLGGEMISRPSRRLRRLATTRCRFLSGMQIVFKTLIDRWSLGRPVKTPISETITLAVEDGYTTGNV